MARRKNYKAQDQNISCLGCSFFSFVGFFFICAMAGSGWFQFLSVVICLASGFGWIYYSRAKKRKEAEAALALEKARNMERIEIIYEDRHGNVTKRRISPMHLKGYDDGSWVLDAFCEDKQAQRSFYLSRIVRCIDCETGEEVKDILEFLKTWNQRHGYEDKQP